MRKSKTCKTCGSPDPKKFRLVEVKNEDGDRYFVWCRDAFHGSISLKARATKQDGGGKFHEGSQQC